MHGRRVGPIEFLAPHPHPRAQIAAARRKARS
jgi:hypothetical protein